MKEYAIGERFDFDGKSLEVKAIESGCTGCYGFKNSVLDPDCARLPDCGSSARSDMRSIRFVEVIQ